MTGAEVTGAASRRPATRRPVNRRAALGWALAGLLPLAFLGVFFAWPVAAIVGLGLREGGVLAALADTTTLDLVAFTLGQAAAATALALLAGMPVAFLLARAKVAGAGVVRAAVMVPFVLPTVVVGLAFRALWPDGGVLPIVLANAFFNVAVVARTVGGLWARLDRRAEDAARALGASRLRAFTSVVLPALAPAVGSAASVVFLFCATSFGVVLVLGGARHRTLETEIYLRTVELFDLPGAAALSLVQFAAVVAVLVLGALARRRREAGLALRAEPPRRPQGGEWGVVAAAWLVVLVLLVPVLALLARSVSTRDGWSLDGYRALAGTGERGTLSVTGVDAALNSLRAATDATLLALLVGVLSAVVLVGLRRSGSWFAEALDTALMLPLGVSAVTVGFGYLITMDALPGDLRTSPALVPLAQALVVTPLVVRMVLPVLRAVDERLRQAAASLGASPWRVWREVDLPLAARSLVAAAGFGYVVALGEFGATSFLARPDAPTLPVVIARLMSRPGELNSQMAYAACALLMVVTAVTVLLVERLRAPGSGEF
ncbi:binding-protein-dependent transport systems inner membrane component [Actinosynnema mirum DSM 43827]|uniref:Binding-protein-dependent transport systems inner membrane component n=1 Tax=Actinosynnema mirum (strain ATCC 29888 / DSM 43827 / JCM 3225 / NBRC 14064 / NCIMB 13271 / NRRL B-12336 / IMRU 3971 / 101) TaxID=446462 RepID=C6WKV4_ACTMD|nr:binding-protein-dependent transport systems inner membrane component [Actinosynnema mirum DSM 43827]